ncbi:Membrane associated histidine kinase-like ATPase [Anaerovibrio sp. JC8]|uniref:GHKL domain-containing protein n=1 Tax=Anaerovibrio sp. JC8 TaxID=1240085 RepID=UPI000A09F031|nr:GHKL domain-containing protein [Anaerovibrio sp. JC8]ORU00847.1 Membrane associated histidine kinase-like ATPase [Anaerovibrio sp. JC8]
MMWVVFLFAFQITLIQIAGIYLRYYAFEEQFTPTAKGSLWKNIALLSLGVIGGYALAFSHIGITVAGYKAALLLGWIPYQYLLMDAIPRQLLHHTFVISMSLLWSFIIHSLSCVVLAFFFMDYAVEEVLQAEACIYIIFFLMLLPLSRYFFKTLLPTFSLFTRHKVRIYIAILPFIMTLGYVAMISDRTLWHSWEERLARLLLPAAFVFTYHYIMGTAKQIYERKRLQHNKSVMKQELLYLEEARLLAADNKNQVQKQLDSLLETYEQLRQLINYGNLEGAKSYIEEQEEKLSAGTILPYTDNAIVNAAISIYLNRAKNAGIEIIPKVNLPRDMKTDENDLSVLLANLLENALLACIKEHGLRQITLILQHNGSQCVLEIANTFNGSLKLGEDGLPKANHSGHGIGMLSLKTFLNKYDGYADFNCENGWARVTIYWEDKLPC